MLARVQRLLDERIIREVTPIFDTRALGYASMLVAAKVDPEHPHRAAKFINSHPGVTHNYLRNHDFNLWFTLAVEPDSQARPATARSRSCSELTGAESIRQLPTLKLFKIRMDLEMEGGTDALSTAGEAVEPLELEPIELSDEDIATIRATQGDMPVVPEPYAPAAERLGVTQERGPRAPGVAAGARRAAPRRRDPLPPPRRLLRQRHGRLEGARGPGSSRSGARMAAFRGISHCYQRPTYADWPYSVFTMAHGRSKEECDAILDAIAEDDGDRTSARRSTPRRSSRRSGCCTSPTTSRRWERGARRCLSAPSTVDVADRHALGRALRAARCTSCPGGVNSPVRAMRSIGRDPIFVERAEGAELIDVDGNRYVDYVCSWGPLIHGHAHPAILEAVAAAAAARDDVRRADRRRGRARRGGRARGCPAVEMLRMTSIGHRGVDERDPPRPRGDRPREAR